VKAFLKAGILGEDGADRETITGTPQGGILSPLLANVALSVLDDHFVEQWESTGSTPYLRRKRRRSGLANYRLVRYADDFVVLVSGIEAHAHGVREEVAAVLAPMGLVLSESKTRICHIDAGFDFLGFRIQRRHKRGTNRRAVYTYPSKKSLGTVIDKVRTLTKGSANPTLKALLNQLNPVLRGWCNYFRHGVSSATFGYLEAYAWRRVIRWLRHRHAGITWAVLRRRHLVGWRPAEGEVRLFDPRAVAVTRYRYRSTTIASPWPSAPMESSA
jgi:RNA-directed DNA polymerase